jgi:hypothetical protein
MLFYDSIGEQDVTSPPDIPVKVSSKVFNITFRESATQVVDFDFGVTQDIINCSIRIKPIENKTWGFAGSVGVKNNCQARETISIILVDAASSRFFQEIRVEDELNISLKEGEDRIVSYTFQKRNPHHEYEVGYVKKPCVRTYGNETMVARATGVEVYHLSCPRWRELEDYKKII